MKSFFTRNQLFRWVSVFFILGFIGLLISTIIPYFSMRPDIGFLRVKFRVLPLWHWRWAFYLHVFSSIPVILGGFIQFSMTLLKQFPVAHRRIGQLYVFLILFISAPSGFWMALYAEGGFWGQLGLSITAILWVIFTALSWIYVLRKDFNRHSDYMVRSYALTLSAIVFRMGTYAGVAWFPMLDPDTVYATIAWLSWIPNLIIAEILIKQRFFILKN